MVVKKEKRKSVEELMERYRKSYKEADTGELTAGQRRYNAALKRLDETIKQGKGGW